MKTILPFATAVLMCNAGFAQPPQRVPRILEDKPGLVAVLDDDGGRVETFRRSDAPRELEFHGGAVIHEPLAHVVFLGDWSAKPSLISELQRRIERLADSEQFRQIGAAGVRRPLALAGSRTLTAPKQINDLRIQAALADALHDGKLALRDENVIYVVFVAPGSDATLGGHEALRDFESYHSHFHAEDTNVRYVVVPFSGDLAAMTEVASKSLVRAIINPDGDGWY